MDPISKILNDPPPKVREAIEKCMDHAFKMMSRPLFPALKSTPYTTDEPNPFAGPACSCSNPACNLPNGFNCRHPL